MKSFRILILEWEKEKILSAVARAFLKQGHEVKKIVIQKTTDFDAVKSEIEAFGPSFCLTNSFYVFDLWKKNGEALEAFLKSKGIPTATWYWDNPLSTGTYYWVRRILLGPYPKDILFFLIDPTHVSFLRERGISAYYLPLAADEADWNTEGLDGSFKERFSFPLSFAGKPCAVIRNIGESSQEMSASYMNFIFREFCQIFRQTKSFSLVREDDIELQMGEVRNVLTTLFSAPFFRRSEFDSHIQSLFAAAEKKLIPPVLEELKIYWARFEFFYSWYLLNETLIDIQDLGLRVFGGPAWGEKLLRKYEFESPYLSDDELKALFAYSKISLCHTKWPFRMAVHERPFLILAAGGFPLTDDRECLSELFTSEEVATYGSLEELRDKISYYLTHDAERKKMADAGRKRVLSSHTYEHRAREILRLVSHHFGI